MTDVLITGHAFPYLLLFEQSERHIDFGRGFPRDTEPAERISGQWYCRMIYRESQSPILPSNRWTILFMPTMIPNSTVAIADA